MQSVQDLGQFHLGQRVSSTQANLTQGNGAFIPELLGSEGWGPEMWGPKIWRLFSLSCHNFLSFFSLLGGPFMKPLGFTRQPKNSKRAHFRAPALQTPPKIHENDQQEREKRMKTVAGE